MYRIVLLILGIGSASAVVFDRASAADDFVCPTPSQQVVDVTVKAEVDGKAQTFLRMGQAELKGGVERQVTELFSKYPNADRVAVINSLLSTTCYLIRNSKQMTDEQKFDKWMAVLPVIRTYLPADKSQSFPQPFLDLATLSLGQQRASIVGALGAAKFVGDIPIRGDQDPKTQVFKWHNFHESYYQSAGYDIRIVYGSNNDAISIFVGLLAEEENPGPIVSFGDWPVETKTLPMRWGNLKFKHVGWKECDQWVNTAMSASLVSITCPYQYRPRGGSTYNRQSCFFSAGYSDGAFGVRLVEDHPELTSFDVDKWREKNLSDEKIRELTWQSIKDRSFNYFMLTCDERLLKQDWN
jgi:hypothetical protein